MKESKRARSRVRDSAPPLGATGGVFPYGRLIVALVAISASIVVAATYLWPRPDSAALPLDGPPPLAWADPQPTIQLPAPAKPTAEELRKELLDLADELVAAFPELPQALHAAALIYADLQKWTEAERIWQKCIKLAPRDAGPYVGLASAAMQLGRDEDAVTTLQQALAAGCSSPEIYHELAAALTKLGQLEQAAAVGDEGLSKFPKAADNWLQLGQTQLQLGQFAAAETSLERALAEGAQSDAVFFSLATACARQGKEEAAARHQGEFERLKSAQQSAAQAPFQDRYDAQLSRIAVAATCRAGAVFARQGEPTQAERWLLRAYALAPTSSAVCTELVSFYRHADRPADARLVQERLMEIEPEVVPHHINYASLSAQVGDLARAEQAFKQVVGMRPEMAIGYLGLAQLYLQMGNYEQARWYAEAALRQDFRGSEEAVEAYLALAVACQQLGDAEVAKSALLKARELAPGDPRLKATVLHDSANGPSELQ